MSLASNPFFWLGELGLIAVIIHCILVCYREQHKILTVVIFFSLLLISMYALVHPAVIMPPIVSPTVTYLLRLMLGIAATYREFQLYVKHKSEDATPEEKRELSLTKKIVTWGVVSGLTVLGWIAWKLR